MTIPKVHVSNYDPLFFKYFTAENIPFKIASPKIGNFIDWDFTMTVLGDANGVLRLFGFTGGFMSLLRYYGKVLLCVGIYGLVILDFCILSK
jgi:hypothetical protein